MRCGPLPSSALIEFRRAVARRVDQHLVEMSECGQAFRGGLEQVGLPEFRPVCQAIVFGVGHGARHQRGAAFHADDSRAAPGDGQGEITQAAKQVGDAFARLRVEQGNGAAHQQAVDDRVDLGEFGRLETAW